MFRRPSRSIATAGVRLGLVCLTLAGLGAAMGCGGTSDAGDEGQPSALQVVRAVTASLLSNAIDAREHAPEEPAAAPLAETAAPPEPVPTASASEAPQTCVVPYSGPVTIVRAPTASAFARSVEDRRRVPLVYETEDTAIWEDGRVVTTDVENLGTHLNAVGWASNPMQILGAAARPGASGRNVGWNSATSSFQDGNRSQKPKRRRRRG